MSLMPCFAYLLFGVLLFPAKWMIESDSIRSDECIQYSAPKQRTTYWEDALHCNNCVKHPQCGFCFPSLQCGEDHAQDFTHHHCKYWVTEEVGCPDQPHCSDYIECRGCAEHAGCAWSAALHRCIDHGVATQGTVVSSADSCDQVSLVTTSTEIIKMVDALADVLIRSLSYQLYVDHVEEDFVAGHTWPLHAVSMAGSFAMWNVVDIYKRVRSAGIEGDFVETGVWKGANGILFARIRNALGERLIRKVYCLDSFEWLPKARPEHKADVGDKHHDQVINNAVLKADVEAVTGIYRRFGLDVEDPAENIEFVKGWFQDTAPVVAEEVKAISILRLDGDMYGSTWEVLVSLYHKVSIGGYVIIDDYHIPGCRMATDHFRSCVGTTSPLQFFIPLNNSEHQHPYAKCFWVKEKEVPLPGARPACYQRAPPAY